MRKSLENLDDTRKSTPPPVLSKKPNVPVKKSPTTSISSMTGSLLSGLKSKVKGMDSKSSSITSHDSFDGIGSSKNVSHIADISDKGVVGEKLKKEDSEFDQVERGSMLQDMRASRAKAPKKRPPSSAINISGDSSYSLLNGSSNSFTDTSIESSPPKHNDDESSKPKPREWEKHKAPWMEELKASQMKKTSPNSTSFDMSKSPESTKHIETTSTSSSSFSSEQNHDTSSLKLNDMSKSFSSSFMSSNRKSSMESSNSIEVRNNSSIEVKSASLIQKELEKKSLPPLSGATKISIIDNTAQSLTTSSTVASMSSTSSSSTSSSVSERVTSTSTHDDLTSTPQKSTRPLSVNLRNRSISPTTISSTNRVAGTKSIHVTSPPDPLISSPIINAASKLNHLHHNESVTTTTVSVTSENVCSRVAELELRVSKLEKLVQSQSNTIDDLVKTLRDEKDKVKVLKTELDKYAQCVTQV